MKFKIEISTSLRRAMDVMDAVRGKLYAHNDMGARATAIDERETISVSVGSYQNGREQGFSIMVFGMNMKPSTHYYFFSECRNSSDVVVYESELDPMQSITDEMYRNARYFDTEDAAASYIFGDIISRAKA